MGMIYLAADHRGFLRKEEIKKWLKEQKVEFDDVGDHVFDKDDDEVDFVKKAASRMGDSDQGIFFCGSGVMVDIAANRIKYLRSCLAFSKEEVVAARHDDDVNVLSIPAEFLDLEKTQEMIEAFLSTKFGNEDRFNRRIGKLDNL